MKNFIDGILARIWLALILASLLQCAWVTYTNIQASHSTLVVNDHVTRMFHTFEYPQQTPHATISQETEVHIFLIYMYPEHTKDTNIYHMRWYTLIDTFRTIPQISTMWNVPHIGTYHVFTALSPHVQ